MPKAYYTDPAFSRSNANSLFGKEWICIGRADELPKPGDFMTFQLCDEPLVAVRGDDGMIRVLSNVCRHRGAILADRHAAMAERLVCPYHHWSYDLRQASLLQPRAWSRTRSFDQTVLPAAGIRLRGMARLRLRQPSANPPPLAPRLAGPRMRLIRNYHMEEMTTRYVVEEVWPVNWKCFIENFMEGYHLSPLHRTTLHPMNPTRLCTHFPPGDA